MHFYFHLRNGDTVELDRDGRSLPDIVEARREAITAAREKMRDDPTYGSAQFELADDAGQYVETIRFEDATTGK